MKFTKPPTDYGDQAALLAARGMSASDPATLMRQLQVVGYYRLCSYWHPFKRPDSTFDSGTSFDVVWQRYVFDRRLRLAVMDAVERVEVAIRTALVTELVMRHGAFAHVDPANFPGAARHPKFLDDLRQEANRSTEAFVAHFRINYDEFPDLPLWAAAETMTFGAMFTLFKMSGPTTQKAIAGQYGLPGPVLFSWLQTLNYVRNICAHHARLWNRELALKPTIPYANKAPHWHTPTPIANNRVFVVLTLLNTMLVRIAPQSSWAERLFALFDAYPSIPLASMGIPDDWRRHPLWR